MAEGAAEVLVEGAAVADLEGEETKDHRQKSWVRLIVDVYLVQIGVMSHLADLMPIVIIRGRSGSARL